MEHTLNTVYLVIIKILFAMRYMELDSILLRECARHRKANIAYLSDVVSNEVVIINVGRMIDKGLEMEH